MRDHGVDWGSRHTRDGVGMDPGLIRALLHAPDAGSGGRASDQLEYAAFYSRQLEEAALPVTRVLVDAVCKGECTYWGTVLAADALVEITCGETPPGEEHSDEDLDSRCRAVVRARLPRLYRMADNETTDDMVLSCLITVVCNVEDDTPTRQAFLERLSHRDLEGASELALQWAQDGEQERTSLAQASAAKKRAHAIPDTSRKDRPSTCTGYSSTIPASRSRLRTTAADVW